MATKIHNTLISDLFVYVPHEKADYFKQQYSEHPEYKTKIAFIEDTHEIFVNGKSFGYNYDDALEALSKRIAQNTRDIETINTNIDLLTTQINNESLVRDLKDIEISNKIILEKDRALKEEANLLKMLNEEKQNLTTFKLKVESDHIQVYENKIKNLENRLAAVENILVNLNRQ